jgi:hypothetical protein
MNMDLSSIGIALGNGFPAEAAGGRGLAGGLFDRMRGFFSGPARALLQKGEECVPAAAKAPLPDSTGRPDSTDPSTSPRRREGGLLFDPVGNYSLDSGAMRIARMQMIHEATSISLSMDGPAASMQIGFQLMRESFMYEELALNLPARMGPGAPFAFLGSALMDPGEVDILPGLDDAVKKELVDLMCLIHTIFRGHAKLDKIVDRIFNSIEKFTMSARRIEIAVTEIRIFYGQSTTTAAPADATSDPLILDVDGDGIELTGVDAGAVFDITGDGIPELVSMPTGGDAFLAMDRDGDGRITSGRELFGDAGGAADGFADLARFDENRDGRITEADGVFPRLRLFRDTNLDGVGEKDELTTLKNEGISALRLDMAARRSTLAKGDILAGYSFFERTDGESRPLAEVFLRIRPVKKS